MAEKITSPILKSLRVLYVEDDLETREELDLILRLCVGELTVACNGLEGLDLFHQCMPDIVITDIQMPEMNGLMMAAEIKKIKPDQAILILSAYNDVEYLFRALEMGIENYITKPVNVERLLNKLTEMASQMALHQEVQRNRKLLNQYKLLVDEKAIVAKLNTDGVITYVNQNFCELSGYAESEMLGQHYSLACAFDANEEVLSVICQSLKETRKWQGILKKRAKNGEQFIVDVTVVAIENERSQIEEYVALMVDMTEIFAKFERLSINLQQDLLKQKHYLREYERAMDLGASLCVLNAEGVVVSANSNFSNSLNCQLEELIGRPFSKIIHDGTDFNERILKQVKSQGYSSKVIKLMVNEGCEKTFSTLVVSIHDPQSGIQSLMGLSRDITDSVSLSEDIIESQKELIYVIGEVVENLSPETGMHIRRVAHISAFMALKCGLSAEHAEMIKIASPMHDIGKVGIPDTILHKPGKLSIDEYAVMKTHANLGFGLLNRLDRPLVQMAAKIAYEHHEHFDGNGYPNGLEGKNISIEGRIVSLVDVVDALGSKRAYKEPWSDDKILEYIISKKGTQFDPELVDILIENYEEIKAIRSKFNDQFH